MDLVLTRDDLVMLEQILQEELLDKGIDHAFVVEISGNLITNTGSFPMEDILPLAALSAANYGATENIAKLIGAEDFSLLFHRGEKESIHSSRIDKDFLLVTLFCNDISVGLVRLGTSRAAERILPILKG